MIEYDEPVGNRKIRKITCEKLDWSNVKEITSYEIAYCIYTYNLSMKNLPEERRKLVEKEIYKLDKIQDEKNNREQIESILFSEEPDEATCKLLNIDLENNNSPCSYIFDPELFSNTKSAYEAIFLVDVLSSRIMNKIMINGVRFKDDKFPKHMKAAKLAKARLIKTYEKIGIPKSTTMDALKSIECELPTTVKKELIAERKKLIKYFITLGNKKTNAGKIATAITLLAEQNIYTTSKF